MNLVVKSAEPSGPEMPTGHGTRRTVGANPSR